MFIYSLDSDFVECLRVFDIFCSMMGSVLSCTSDSTTLPDRTLCQINEDEPFVCK